MVELVWKEGVLRVTEAEAVKILKDQEYRCTVFKVVEKWELKDKKLKFENGAIIRTGEKSDKGKA